MTTKKEKSEPAKTSDANQGVRIFDVAKPGTLPPADATSRPVIVTNRPIMQDPMMAPQAASDLPPEDPTKDRPGSLGTKLVITPMSDQEPEPAAVDADSDGVVEAGEQAAVDSKPEPDSKAEPVSKPEPKPEAPAGGKLFKPLTDTVVTKPTETPASVSETTPTAASTDGQTPVDPEKANLDKEAAELEAAAKVQDELDTLVEQKTYFLDINSVERRRSMHVFVYGFLLIIILVLAWVNIALDAGLIQIDGVKSLTHFFDTP